MYFRVLKNNTNPIYILSGNDTNLIRNYIKKWNLPINPNNVYGEMGASDKLKFILNVKRANNNEMFVMIDDNKDFITYLQKNSICSAIHYKDQGIVNDLKKKEKK